MNSDNIEIIYHTQNPWCLYVDLSEKPSRTHAIMFDSDGLDITSHDRVNNEDKNLYKSKAVPATVCRKLLGLMPLTWEYIY